jgi:hypothetical protein
MAVAVASLNLQMASPAITPSKISIISAEGRSFPHGLYLANCWAAKSADAMGSIFLCEAPTRHSQAASMGWCMMIVEEAKVYMQEARKP